MTFEKFFMFAVTCIISFCFIVVLGLSCLVIKPQVIGSNAEVIAKALKKHDDVLTQYRERMGAMDRRIDARIRTERNTKKLFKDLGHELKIDGEGE